MSKIDEYNKIDKRLNSISKKLSFQILNPTNLDTEYEKFLSKKNYSPQFEYRHKSYGQIKRSLQSIHPDNSVVGKILEGIRDSYSLTIQMMENRGTGNFSNYSEKIYGKPNKQLLTMANKLVHYQIQPETRSYTTKQIINKLKLAFVKYGFHWDVVEKKMIANAAVSVEHKKLFIRRDSRFSHNFLKRIIVHEIGTHIMRAENGESQPYSFFRRGLPGYLMTEEGLAVYNEEAAGCLNNYILKVYAGRVLAVSTALNCSFYDTFAVMRKYFTKNTAWRLTLRAKRGLSDTSLPGAFTKDIAYLQGYLKIKDFIKKGGDITKLYYGKVGLQHIDLIDQMPQLIHPGFLPMMRYVKYFKGHFSDVINNVVFMNNIKPIILNLKIDEP